MSQEYRAFVKRLKFYKTEYKPLIESKFSDRKKAERWLACMVQSILDSKDSFLVDWGLEVKEGGIWKNSL